MPSESDSPRPGLHLIKPTLWGTRVRYGRRNFYLVGAAGFLMLNTLVGSMFLLTDGWARTLWLAILILANFLWILLLIHGPNPRVLVEQAERERVMNQRAGANPPSPRTAEKALAFARRVFQKRISN